MYKWSFITCLAVLTACSTQKKLGRQTQQLLLDKPALASAHIGIAIADATTGRQLYQHQGEKYFIPASNTKLLTCYAAMKYLGDSLTAFHYRIDPADGQNAKTVVQLQPAGDPTLLHPDFIDQPVLRFLLSDTSRTYIVNPARWEEQPFGMGWSWDDYQEDYMAERSPLPVYGNVVRIKSDDKGEQIHPSVFSLLYGGSAKAAPAFNQMPHHSFSRKKDANELVWSQPDAAAKKIYIRDIPFITSVPEALRLLGDTAKGANLINAPEQQLNSAPVFPFALHSQPTDSMLKLMMYRSDNFFAEQSLLMVSNTLLKKMNDDAVIDTLLATDYRSFPQRPQWVDGSGLSRFNLVTPCDLVALLIKMKNDFSWQRITGILSGSNTGTLTGYYQAIPGHIYAKTGSLSNNLALSGYLITRKQHTLAFSILIGNHTGQGRPIRRLIEAYLLAIYEKY